MWENTACENGVIPERFKTGEIRNIVKKRMKFNNILNDITPMENVINKRENISTSFDEYQSKINKDTTKEYDVIAQKSIDEAQKSEDETTKSDEEERIKSFHERLKDIPSHAFKTKSILEDDIPESGVITEKFKIIKKYKIFNEGINDVSILSNEPENKTVTIENIPENHVEISPRGEEKLQIFKDEIGSSSLSNNEKMFCGKIENATVENDVIIQVFKTGERMRVYNELIKPKQCLIKQHKKVIYPVMVKDVINVSEKENNDNDASEQLPANESNHSNNSPIVDSPLLQFQHALENQIKDLVLTIKDVHTVEKEIIINTLCAEQQSTKKEILESLIDILTEKMNKLQNEFSSQQPSLKGSIQDSGGCEHLGDKPSYPEGNTSVQIVHNKLPCHVANKIVCDVIIPSNSSVLRNVTNVDGNNKNNHSKIRKSVSITADKKLSNSKKQNASRFSVLRTPVRRRKAPMPFSTRPQIANEEIHKQTDISPQMSEKGFALLHEILKDCASSRDVTREDKADIHTTVNHAEQYIKSIAGIEDIGYKHQGVCNFKDTMNDNLTTNHPGQYNKSTANSKDITPRSNETDSFSTRLDIPLQASKQGLALLQEILIDCINSRDAAVDYKAGIHTTMNHLEQNTENITYSKDIKTQNKENKIPYVNYADDSDKDNTSLKLSALENRFSPEIIGNLEANKHRIGFQVIDDESVGKISKRSTLGRTQSTISSNILTTHNEPFNFKKKISLDERLGKLQQNFINPDNQWLYQSKGNSRGSDATRENAEKVLKEVQATRKLLEHDDVFKCVENINMLEYLDENPQVLDGNVLQVRKKVNERIKKIHSDIQNELSDKKDGEETTKTVQGKPRLPLKGKNTKQAKFR